MKKLSFVIPIMIVVAILAIWMLNKDYAEIDFQIRLVIALGAALLSGVISYFLFAFDKEK
ncbi:heme/copper-type cytochrome/quinol oxidase subunit 4 [Cytobacillus eiseniae]|uniref:Heme/copper-type cytochrome/quinol oxidase subunit 4 n=1 Tax=Cytobacillus eiseniae TaxID=762947 RepID=A0ABS4RE64_9BACI|nr:histidine kinase [Cytobacillus eiseniae]MBP2241028.1 heme/copper-type cytochrome/quinol oxidase subunit 4 [Cytobacillus eiseniae]